MPGNPLTDPRWATELADTVERLVGTVRDRATKPIVTASRAIVFGLIALFLAVVAVVLLLVTACRGLQSLLDIWLPHSRSVYVSYLIIGGMLSIAGLFIMMRKRSPES
jgi:hypothetical protein